MKDNEYNKVNSKRKKYRPVPLLSGVEEMRQDFEERIEQGDVKYGVEILDDAVETIRKGSLTIIQARPNTGKSLLGQIIAKNLAKQGKKVLICSCEMGAALLMEREFKNLCGITPKQLRDLYEYQRDKANYILDTVFDSQYDFLKNIDICETGGATVEDLIEMFNICNEYDYIVVDYIQRIRGEGKEYEVITNAARELQTYARQTKKALIICSQAKRANGKEDVTQNAGAQGKGSGSIEEDGDIGILLSELLVGDEKTILMTLFKNKYGSLKNITYKYRLDDRLNLILAGKNYVPRETT